MLALSRRAAITLALGGAAGSLAGCALFDHANLVALRNEHLAKWMPEDVIHEERLEMNPTRDFVGATDAALLMRIFTVPDEAAAIKGKAAARASALADGWQVREDQQGRITKTLPNGTSAALEITDSFPKPKWTLAMSA